MTKRKIKSEKNSISQTASASNSIVAYLMSWVKIISEEKNKICFTNDEKIAAIRQLNDVTNQN